MMSFHTHLLGTHWVGLVHAWQALSTEHNTETFGGRSHGSGGNMGFGGTNAGSSPPGPEAAGTLLCSTPGPHAHMPGASVSDGFSPLSF